MLPPLQSTHLVLVAKRTGQDDYSQATPTRKSVCTATKTHPAAIKQGQQAKSLDLVVPSKPFYSRVAEFPFRVMHFYLSSPYKSETVAWSLCLRKGLARALWLWRPNVRPSLHGPLKLASNVSPRGASDLPAPRMNQSCARTSRSLAARNANANRRRIVPAGDCYGADLRGGPQPVLGANSAHMALFRLYTHGAHSDNALQDCASAFRYHRSRSSECRFRRVRQGTSSF